jgi:hypothetical protein
MFICGNFDQKIKKMELCFSYHINLRLTTYNIKQLKNY